jgi:hypothetical protein
MRAAKRFAFPEFFMRKTLWGVSLSVMFTFQAGSLLGQITARAIGMGSAYTAVARGVHAPDWNPANLGLPDNPQFSFTFLATDAGIKNNSFSWSMYNQYLTNGDENDEIYWDQNDVEEILDHVPENGFNMDFGASVKVLSFSSGQFAFSLGAVARSFLQLDKHFFELPLKGNEFDRTYLLDDTDGEGIAVGMASFSYGHPLQVSFADHFAIGGTFNLFYGMACFELDRAHFSLGTKEYGFNVDGDYELTYARGGMGWGVNLGGAAQLQEKWTLSLGLENLIGSIPWPNDVNREFGFFKGDSVTAIDFDEDDDEDEAFTDSSWSVDGERFSKKLPLVLRLGCAYREGSYLITADYMQGIQKGAWVGTNPQFSFGTEWWGVDWLPLRMGVVFGGRIGFGTSFGFGLRPGGFVFDFAIMNRGFITPGSSKGCILALEFGLELHKQEPEEGVRVRDF